MKTALLFPVLLCVACGSAEPTFTEATSDCMVSDMETIDSELAQLGGTHQAIPLETQRIDNATDYEAYLETSIFSAEGGLEEMSISNLREIDFTDHHILTAVIQGEPCEYIWEGEDDQPELFRLDDTSLLLQVPVVRSAQNCAAAAQRLPMLFVVPASEAGEIAEICVLR